MGLIEKTEHTCSFQLHLDHKNLSNRDGVDLKILQGFQDNQVLLDQLACPVLAGLVRPVATLELEVKCLVVFYRLMDMTQ